MKKIIVKCRLKNKDAFESKLADIDMHFDKIFWQHDRIYFPRNYKRGQNYPRLIMRTEMAAVDKPAKYYLILKRHIEDSGVDIVDSTIVKDYIEASQMIHQLGFNQYAEISRRRMNLEMGKGVVIHLDKIENIPGYYAKIEAILEEGEKVSEVQEDLIKTFKILEQEEIVGKTYGELLAENHKQS